MLQLGVLISGRGSNLQAIIDAVAERRLDAELCVVISNRPGAAGLKRAREAGVMTEVTDHKLFDSRARFERQLVRRLHAHGARWVVLAGFMRILTSVFLEAFPDRVVNIHPSLLPAFPGVDAQRQALDYGVKVSGCSVHLVSEGVDAGPLLAQAAVPIEADDTRDRLADRILVREHELLVSTLQAIAEGRLSLDKSGGRTRAWLR